MHEVVNQAPPRVGFDEYAENPALVEAVERNGGGWGAARLQQIGRLVGSPEFQRDAELANIREPELRLYDRWGRRIDEVDYDDAYHRVISADLAAGGHSLAWAEPGPGAEAVRAGVFLLFAQIEPGHSCPVSMTHAALPVVRAHPVLGPEWTPRLLSASYDPELRSGKRSALVGMAMTEKQGGSDVRANTTTATPTGGDGAYVLDGHKWFCSAPMSDAVLVLAQAPGGLSCFLVPRVLPDGARNPFRIARLKDKLGNRSNASSEVEFEGTVGFLLGEEGRGVRTIIDMVQLTRFDSVLGTTAGMRQAAAEAAWHARHRAAFGAVLIDQPAMTAVIADLQLETEAATALALRLARAHDADAPDSDVALRRIATAVAKYWICKRGPGHASEALECLGGNGYTEAFPLARRYREQPVMAIWEGSGNVLALDVLRALRREPDAGAALEAELALAAGAHPAYDAHLARVRRTLAELAAADDAEAASGARRLAADLALALEAGELLRHAPAPVAELFVSSRLGEGAASGHLYGALPRGDHAAVAARA